MKNFSLSLIAFLVLNILACNRKNIKQSQSTQPENVQKIEEVSSVDTEAGEETDIRNPEFLSHDSLKTIYFEFDKYEISPEMAQILSDNARVLKEKKWTVLIEGHCDNRGTIEYNLALGQKRANIVKDYYIRLGVPETSIGTISYGEENPLCKEDTESCWAKNRRAETKVSQ